MGDSQDLAKQLAGKAENDDVKKEFTLMDEKVRNLMDLVN